MATHRRTGRWKPGPAGFLALTVLGLVLVALGGLAHAQPKASGPPALPEPLTKEAIRELVARLSDVEVRQLLIAQLDRAAAPPRPAAEAAGMLARMEGESDRVRTRAVELVHGGLALPGALMDARDRFIEGRGTGHLALVMAIFVALMGVGWLVERIVRWATGSLRRTVEQPAEGLAAQAIRSILWLMLEVLALAAFAAGAMAGFFALYQGHPPSRAFMLAYLGAVLIVRVVSVLSRFLLAPNVPARRLLPFGDVDARRLHRGVIRLAVTYAFGMGTITLFQGLGAPPASVEFLMIVLSSLFLWFAVRLVWGALRQPIARLILGTGEAGFLRRLIADLWPILATAYLIGIYVARVWTLLSGATFVPRAPILSVVLLVALPLVSMVLKRVLSAMLFGRRTGEGAPSGGTLASLEPVLQRAVQVVVVVLGMVVFGRLWNVDLFQLADTGLGDRISGALLGIGITVLMSWVLWEIARTIIDRKLAAETGGGSGLKGEEGGAPASRLRTLLPLLRGFLLVSIMTMATLSILAALGINIVPLLAGAGVVGLAIGFGSQTLVRDIVSGAFFLMDDAFRIGEYVEAGDSKGTVERITIRSLHLRHHRGPISILPYGEIKRLRNTSRDWMIMTMEFRLTYDTDLFKVKKIFRRIGEELGQDPELGQDIIEPLKSQGVLATEDSALLVRAKFMARPGNSPYMYRREAYQRILKAFAAEGIKFASRQVTVFVPEGGTAPAGGSGGLSAGAAAALAATPPKPSS